MSNDANNPSVDILNRMRDNAVRLCEDATTLINVGSWASATALAILSIEEFGKYFEMKWGLESENVSKKNRSHRRKQSVPFSIYGAKASLAVILTLTDRLGITEAVRDQPQAFLRFVDFLKQHPRYSEIAALAEEGAVELLARVMADNPGMIAMDRARRGELEQVKRRSLYFDLDADGQVISDPHSIQAETAQEWVNHARYLSAHTTGEMQDDSIELHEETYLKYFPPVLVAVRELLAEMTPVELKGTNSTNAPQDGT